MNVNRHPAGTSAGGRWAPSGASEVEHELGDQTASDEAMRTQLGADAGHIVSEVYDEETTPVASGLVKTPGFDSTAYGVSRDASGDYRVRLLIEDDREVPAGVGDRIYDEQVRANIHIADTVASTGDVSTDAASIQSSIGRMQEAARAKQSTIDDRASDVVDDEEKTIDVEYTFDERIEARFADDEIEVLP